MDESHPGDVQRENEQLRFDNAQLHEVAVQQQALIEELRAEIVELKARLGQNSRNSSKPPSSEGYAKPSRQQRRAVQRKAGKQPGAEGSHLARVDDPDDVIVHEPESCRSCGHSLEDTDIVDEEVRQVFDLPRRKVIVREHRARKRRCRCGKTTKASFPAEAINVTCYGPTVRALAVYLVCGHHLPFERAAVVMSDICGLSIAVGSVVNTVVSAGVGLDAFAVAVRDALRSEALVHFDETGARVAGKLFWVHSASTDQLTAYIMHANRGNKAMDEMGLLALHDKDGKVVWSFDGIAMHDGWRCYRSYAVVHALCNAHHIRELRAAGEVWNQTWAIDMIELLRSAKRSVEQAKTQGHDGLDAATYHGIVSRYGRLVAQGFETNPKQARRKQSKAFNLLLRLREHRDDVLRFTSDFDAPFDNNQACDTRSLNVSELTERRIGKRRTCSFRRCSNPVPILTCVTGNGGV